MNTSTGNEIDYIDSNKIQIETINVLVDGESVSSDNITIVCAYENYVNFIRLYYTLNSLSGDVLTSGNIELKDDEYLEFVSKPFHNKEAIIIVTTKLNLVLKQIQ